MNNKKPIKPWSMKCPECNNPYAYTGYMAIECINVGCKHYSLVQKNLVDQYFDEQMKIIAHEEEIEKSKQALLTNKVNVDADQFTDDDSEPTDPYGFYLRDSYHI